VIGGRATGYALLAFAGLLLVLAVMSGWSGAQRIGSREDDTRAVESAAAAFVTAYGTFDHRDPDAYATRLIALTTGAMRDALAEAAVDPDAARLRRAITTRIESVSLTALSRADATALVTAVQERRWVDPVLGTALGEDIQQRVTCRLVQEDGRWLVVELRVQSEEPVRVEAR
jgi:hypothetical protein